MSDIIACIAGIMQRLADAEQHMVELRSRILGLTALNAELTKKLKDQVTETVVVRALEARNAELQEQLTAADKEISGLQVHASTKVSLMKLFTCSSSAVPNESSCLRVGKSMMYRICLSPVHMIQPVTLVFSFGRRTWL